MFCFLSQNLDDRTFPQFVDALSDATVSNSDRVVASPANIHTIVSVFTRLANASRSLPINVTVMTVWCNLKA